jgi:hypothetical protein
MPRNGRSKSRHRKLRSTPWDFYDSDIVLQKISAHVIWCSFILVVNLCFFSSCYNGLNYRFSNYSKQVQLFAEGTPSRFEPYIENVNNHSSKLINVTEFRESTAKWHRDLRDLQESIEKKFNLEFQRDWDDDDFVPVCSNVKLAYTVFLAADSFMLLILILVVLRIVYKDFCTVYGANRRSVVIQFHATLAAVECLLIFNFPLYQLSMAAVGLAYQFKRSVDALKKIQVNLLATDDPQMFDDLYLRASIWQGKRFGVKEPLSGIHLDTLYVDTFRTRTYLFILAIAISVSILMWRASVRSITRWRRNVNAVCSIGIVIPNGTTIFRVGSGVLVNGVNKNGRSSYSSKPLIITNWHCIHDIVDVSKSPASQKRTSLKLRTHVNVLQSQTSITRKSCSYDAPGWKILIGVRDVESSGKGDIRWSYTGKIIAESPMREFVTRKKVREVEEVEEVKESRTSGRSAASAVGLPDDENGGEDNDGATNVGMSAPRMARQMSELYQDSLNQTSEPPSSTLQRTLSSSSLEDYLTGIDISILTISKEIKVHGLKKSANNRNYIFDSIEETPVEEGETSFIDNQQNQEQQQDQQLKVKKHAQILKRLKRLKRFDTVNEGVGESFFFLSMSSLSSGLTSPSVTTLLSVRMSDQLRLMGYPPDAGGYDMSILTTFFTGVDYQDRQKNEGRYLLANTVLPNGFSGGAAVNDDGELVGICTAEYAGISCIRDYVDVKPLVMNASQILLDREVSEISKIKNSIRTTLLDNVRISDQHTESNDTNVSVVRLRRQLS